MRKSIAATTLAACVALGGVSGAYLGVPGVAGAAESATASATGAVSWVQDSLHGLVDDGTITQAQADKVESALETARPAMGDVAKDKGVDIGTVVDKIVAAQKEKIDERVTDGDLTQARAEERATALVDGELPAFGRGRRHRGFRGPDAPDALASPDATVAPSSLTF